MKTKKKTLTRAVCGACLIALSNATPPVLAAVVDWRPELVAPKGNFYGPNDPVRLRMPKLPVEVLQRLALELDDLDVTGMVARENDFAIFTPPQPLAYGEHQLRLVEYAANGDIIERGVWTLAVRKSATFREAQLQAVGTLNAVSRISEDDLPEPKPERNQLNGAAQIQGALADGNWRAAGQMDLIYASEYRLLPRGDEGDHLDMGSFLLAYEHGPVVARAGHHSVGPDSLIMSGFTRRGVSVGLQSADSGASATAFSLRTQDIIGFQHGFGVGDSENRTDGVVITGRPIPGKRDALTLSATYLQGEGPSQTGAVGTGIAGDTTAIEGRAAGLIADANVLDKRLRLRGEYATSRFDFDGKGRDTDLDGVIDSDQDPERDRAYAALVTWVPWHDKLVNNQPLIWHMGVENKRLGTFFRSPANPIGLSDRQLLRGFTGVNWSGLDVQLSLGRETDNVNDLSLLPRTATAQNVLSFTYTPQINLQPLQDGSLPPLPWYGQPMLNATYIGVKQEVDEAGAGLAKGKLNDLSTLALTASFTYATWSWSLGHTLATNENFIDTAADTDTAATQLNASFRVGERFTLTPMLQYSKTEETDPPAGLTAKDTTTTTVGLSASYAFSERVIASLGYNVNRQDASDDSFDTTTKDVIGSLAWTVVPPQGARPGFALSLDGQYHDVDDRVFAANTVNNYQVFLKASVSWAPNF
jgi:hypothetical protein